MAPPRRSRFMGHFRILRSAWPQIRLRFWRLWSDDDSDNTVHGDGDDEQTAYFRAYYPQVPVKLLRDSTQSNDRIPAKFV
jgi:hypothetical protein